MKEVILKVVDKKPDSIKQAEYDAAKKLGELEMHYATAIENVKLSNGLYEIKPEPKDMEAEFNFNGVPIAEMSRSQLFMAAMTFGVTISKKNIPSDKLRQLVQTKFDEFVNAEEDPKSDEDND